MSVPFKSDGYECKHKGHKVARSLSFDMEDRDGERLWHNCIECWSAKAKYGTCDLWQFLGENTKIFQVQVHIKQDDEAKHGHTKIIIFLAEAYTSKITESEAWKNKLTKHGAGQEELSDEERKMVRYIGVHLERKAPEKGCLDIGWTVRRKKNYVDISSMTYRSKSHSSIITISFADCERIRESGSRRPSGATPSSPNKSQGHAGTVGALAMSYMRTDCQHTHTKTIFAWFAVDSDGKRKKSSEGVAGFWCVNCVR